VVLLPYIEKAMSNKNANGYESEMFDICGLKPRRKVEAETSTPSTPFNDNAIQ
jgi:hypothetical protein